jgi:hypothetical protein
MCQRQVIEVLDLLLEFLVPLPDFITSARRELMLSVVFFAFLVGAISRFRILLMDLWDGNFEDAN